MTTGQGKFINDLLAQKDIPSSDGFNGRYLERVNAHKNGYTLTTAEASGLIDWLLQLRKKPVTTGPIATANGVEAEGVYVVDSVIVKMKRSKQSQRLYAMRLVEIGGRRLTEADTVINFEWEYAPALTNSVKLEDKMTTEQAKEFGIRYGKCMRCGRRLKDATSVERAIGPICFQWFAPTGAKVPAAIPEAAEERSGFQF
jgi:hypothetical protein